MSCYCIEYRRAHVCTQDNQSRRLLVLRTWCSLYAVLLPLVLTHLLTPGVPSPVYHNSATTHHYSIENDIKTCGWCCFAHRELQQGVALARAANLPADFKIQCHPYMLNSGLADEAVSRKKYFGTKLSRHGKMDGGNEHNDSSSRGGRH